MAGLEPGALDPALELEMRKWGIPLDRIDATLPEACLQPTAEAVRVMAVIGDGSKVLIRDATGAIRILDLATTSLMDRARVVAQAVVALVPAGPTSSPPRIVDEGMTLPAVGPSSMPPRPTEPRVQGYAQVGGSYGYQPGPALHLFGTEFEAGAAFFQERLEIGLGIGWEPNQAIESAAMTASIQTVPVFLALRGGWKVAPVLFRAGLIAGFEWRQISFRPQSHLQQRFATSEAAILGGEVELVFQLTRAFRLTAVAFGRGFIGGPSYSWDGLRVYDAPASSFGAAIRFGAVFPQVGHGGN